MNFYLEANMARKKSSLLNDLSTADLKRLLVARERIDVLEKERSALAKELARVEKELGKLMADPAGSVSKPARKTTRKTVKKAARKKAGAKKVAAKKVAGGKAKGPRKKNLEDVVVSVIRKKGSAIPFQDLKGRIVKGKLFKTKSGNFDNVLRRTLSTSKKVKRVGRGIYDVA